MDRTAGVSQAAYTQLSPNALQACGPDSATQGSFSPWSCVSNVTAEEPVLSQGRSPALMNATAESKVSLEKAQTHALGSFATPETYGELSSLVGDIHNPEFYGDLSDLEGAITVSWPLDAPETVKHPGELNGDMHTPKFYGDLSNLESAITESRPLVTPEIVKRLGELNGDMHIPKFYGDLSDLEGAITVSGPLDAPEIVKHPGDLDGAVTAKGVPDTPEIVKYPSDLNGDMSALPGSARADDEIRPSGLAKIGAAISNAPARLLSAAPGIGRSANKGIDTAASKLGALVTGTVKFVGKMSLAAIAIAVGAVPAAVAGLGFGLFKLGKTMKEPVGQGLRSTGRFAKGTATGAAAMTKSAATGAASMTKSAATGAASMTKSAATGVAAGMKNATFGVVNSANTLAKPLAPELSVTWKPARPYDNKFEVQLPKGADGSESLGLGVSVKNPATVPRGVDSKGVYTLQNLVADVQADLDKVVSLKNGAVGNRVIASTMKSSIQKHLNRHEAAAALSSHLLSPLALAASGVKTSLRAVSMAGFGRDMEDMLSANATQYNLSAYRALSSLSEQDAFPVVRATAAPRLTGVPEAKSSELGPELQPQTRSHSAVL